MQEAEIVQWAATYTVTLAFFKWQFMVASTPTTVPCITVPFFSSMVTCSLFSFCKNLTNFIAKQYRRTILNFRCWFAEMVKSGCGWALRFCSVLVIEFSWFGTLRVNHRASFVVHLNFFGQMTILFSRHPRTENMRKFQYCHTCTCTPREPTTTYQHVVTPVQRSRIFFRSLHFASKQQKLTQSFFATANKHNVRSSVD